MNADDWQAVGEIGSFAIVVGSVIGSIVIALLRMRFVTRVEHVRAHDALNERIEGVEAEIGTKVGKEDLQHLSQRLYACERALGDTNVQLAKTNALQEATVASNEHNAQALKDATRSLERQIGLLMQNELSREPK